MENICCQRATAGDMPAIAEGIKQLQLDDLDLRWEQFVVAKEGEKIIGFGRIKTYMDAIELCSLGVLEGYRGKGISTLLMNDLLKRAGEQSVFVICIIPAYFEKFGFKPVDNYPDSLIAKYTYCSNTLGGCGEGEKYVVMRKKGL